MLVTTNSNESLQKFLDKQSEEYVNDLMGLCKVDINSACIKLRADSCEPIMNCKKFLYGKLEDTISNQKRIELKIINGDISEASESVIIHQVNCMNAMGSGVAKALFTKWPKVKTEYHKFCENKTPNELLSQISSVSVENVTGRTSKYVINCYSQLTYGNDGKRHTDYEAVKTCFEKVFRMFPDKNIAIPYYYGCGLGGGDWGVVSELIEKIFGDHAIIYKI